MQIPINIGSFPIQLILCPNATLAFVRRANFNNIIDGEAVFTNTESCIEGNVFSYDTLYPYKNIPSMLQWLIRQDMFLPIEKNIWELNAYP